MEGAQRGPVLVGTFFSLKYHGSASIPLFLVPVQGFFPNRQGWISLVSVCIGAAVWPPSKKYARHIIGNYVWAVQPGARYIPFLSGWWADYQ